MSFLNVCDMGNVFKKPIKKSVHDTLISRKRVEDWVDAYLEREACNMKYVPDCIERSIYISVMLLLLTLVEQGAKDLHLNLVNHIIEVRLKPPRDSNALSE